MFKRFLMGAAMAVLGAGVAEAAVPPGPSALSWVIQPGDAGCRAELELTGKSGAVVPVTLLSDGEVLTLRFAKDGLPERAFLPIRVDQKPYSNLMLRTENTAVGELVLSPETQGALRRGGTLQLAWLSDEPVGASLAGSDHGIPDLMTCGAQSASLHKAKLAAESEARARAEADARDKAIADAKLAAVQAQAAAAEADRVRIAEEAERQRVAADAERQRLAYEQERQQRENAQSDRERAYQDALRRYGYEDTRPQAEPQPSPWTPRYPYRRY